jgi:hypothetical protein
MTRSDYLRRDKPPTVAALLFDFLKARFLSIIFAFMIFGSIIAYFQFDLSVPRRARLAGFTFLFLLPAGYMVGNYIKNLLWSPNYVYLVDLDAAEVDGALFQFPFDHFRALEVVEGELCQLTTHLYTGKDVDLAAGTVKGTWRGTLSDRELLRCLQKVAECRGTLEDDAKRGFVLETSAFMIISQAARKTVIEVVRMFEKGSLPDDGNALTAEIDAALERYGLEEKVEEIADTEYGDVEAAVEDPAGEDDTEPGTDPVSALADKSSDSEAAADD